MLDSEILKKLQGSSIEDRIRIIEAILNTLKQDIDPSDFPQSASTSRPQRPAFGFMKGTGKILGDIVAPIPLPNDSEALSRLAKLKEITELGLMVYTAVGFQEFLKTPLPVFAGRCAFDLLQLGDYETVLSAIAADFEGTVF